MKQKYQPNQILKSANYANDDHHYLIVAVCHKYLVLKDLFTDAIIYPSTNSVFLDFCICIGTTDSHPELLI